MPVVALIGAQWGDEGKGHITDLLAGQSQMVIRYNGGGNAGHTVINDKGAFKLHHIPAGIFDSTISNIIGPGVVINPEVLIAELDALKGAGVNVNNLLISDRAHIMMPYHGLQEQLQEEARNEERSGFAPRGISQTYADKMSLVGLRLGDLMFEETLLQRLRVVLEEKNQLLTKLYNVPPISLHETYMKLLSYAQALNDSIMDVNPIVHAALALSENVLLEGSQGALLDVDHGTYPYAAASAPGAAGACQGSGIPPMSMTRVVGVAKAYTTRMGGGPFPTEALLQDAEIFRQHGMAAADKSAATGRARRVGWFDAVVTRYVTLVNGMNDLIVTKLDALDGLDTVKICTSYRLHDTTLENPPAAVAIFEQVEPIYEELPGWKKSTANARRFEDLPDNAQSYLHRLCEVTGTTLAGVSVGPRREQVIMTSDIFAPVIV